MRILIVLLAIAFGSAQAAPVNLTLEVVQYFDSVNNFDNPDISSLDKYPDDGGRFFTFDGGRTIESSYDSSSNIVFGGAESGWHYESQVIQDEMSLSVNASSLVYASAHVPSDGPANAGFDSSYAYVSQINYWLEFVVTERVSYSGTFALTNGLLELGNTATYEFGWNGNIFESGTVLQPGTYQYWARNAGRIGGSTVPPFPSTRARADNIGQADYSEANADFEFQFTVVPLPAAFWFFASGLIGLGWFRRAKT